MPKPIKTISDLTPDPKNPRKRTERSSGMLSRSLEEVGAARSIVIDENGQILAGNGTVEAAAQVGIENVKVVDADGNTIIAVRRSGLTEEQKIRLALFDNRTADLADWDTEILLELDKEVDLSAYFTDIELNELSLTLEDDEGDRLSNNTDNENRPEENKSLELLFPSTNEFGIPDLLLTHQAKSIHVPFIKWGTRSRKDGGNNGTVHFYAEDYKFNAVWDDPNVLKKSGAVCAVEPNYSTNNQMPKICVLWTIFKKRWLARYWQQQGIEVVVDLAVAPRYRDLTLIGVPEGWKSYATHFYPTHDEIEWIEEDYKMACNHAGSENIIFVVYGGGDTLGKQWQDKGWLWFPSHHKHLEDRNG